MAGSKTRRRLKSTTLMMMSVFLSTLACVAVANPDPPTPFTFPTPNLALTDLSRNTSTPTMQVTPMPAASLTPPATATLPVSFSDTLASIAYRLPLTIQHVYHTGATLLFEFETPVRGTLLLEVLEGAPADPIIVDLDPSQTRHQIELRDLSPDTLYRVRVGVGDQPEALSAPSFQNRAWDEQHLRTAAAEPTHFSAAVFGDSGFGQQVTYDLAAQIAAQGVDFSLHTGDLVYNVDEDPGPVQAFQRKYFAPLEALLVHMPLYPVLGNHDLDPPTRYEGQAYYYHAFPAFSDPAFEPSDRDGQNAWYAFERAGVQFLMLDTQVFFGEAGREAQTAWLMERLADPRFQVSIPVFHVAAFTSGLHPRDGRAIQQEWSPLFEAASVPLVLAGHDHNYERLRVGDVTYIVTGGGSATLYGQSELLPESQFFARRTHFTRLDFYSDRIEVSAVDVNGEIFDSINLSLP